MVAALFASQVNAQGMIGIQPNQAAYANLTNALRSGDGSESADETAVQAARAAGLSDEQIAGALQETNRSVDQQIAALLPSNPTQDQATRAASAVVNATNSTGVRTGNVTQNQISAGLQSAGIPAVTASTIAVNASSTNNATLGTQITSFQGSAPHLNSLSPTGAGQSSISIGGGTSTLTVRTSGGGGGPAIGSAFQTVATSNPSTNLPPIVDAALPTSPPPPVIPPAPTPPGVSTGHGI